VFPRSFPSYQAVMEIQGDSPAEFEVATNGSGNVVIYHDTTNVPEPTSNGTLSADSWNHVVVTRSGSTVRIYINGAQDANTLSDGATLNFSTCPILIGVDADTGCTGELNGYFDGLIDEVRIYNRALSATEAKRLYNLGRALAVKTPRGSLTSGLVGYWTFDGPDLSGTTALDRSGQGNDLTLTGGPIATVGELGQALSFDGVGDYLTRAHAAALEPDDLSVTLWVKRNGTQTANAQVLGKHCSVTASNIWSYALEFDGNGTALQWEIDDDQLTLPMVVSGAIADNTWTFVAGTYRNSTKTLELFVNASSQGTTVLPGARDKGTLDLNIGGYGTCGGGDMKGQIDEVRVYNRALSAAEVTRLYGMGRALAVKTPRTSLTSGLVGYWTFDGPDLSGATATDRSGQGNNGTLNGPVRTVGKLGQALQFDGSGDFITIPHQAALNFSDATSQFTISAWVKMPAFTSTVNSVLTKWDVSQRSWILSVENSAKPALRLSTTGAGTDMMVTSTGSALLAGQWHHVVATADIGTDSYKIYVDGIEQSTSGSVNISSIFAGTATLNIGATKKGTDDLFNSGVIDEVRLYNRALSADEIERLYQMGH